MFLSSSVQAAQTPGVKIALRVTVSGTAALRQGPNAVRVMFDRIRLFPFTWQ